MFFYFCLSHSFGLGRCKTLAIRIGRLEFSSLEPRLCDSCLQPLRWGGVEGQAGAWSSLATVLTKPVNSRLSERSCLKK